MAIPDAGVHHPAMTSDKRRTDAPPNPLDFVRRARAVRELVR